MIKGAVIIAIIVAAVFFLSFTDVNAASGDGGSNDARGGNITSIDIFRSSQTTYWQGYYGIITSSGSPVYTDYFNLSGPGIFTIRKLELGADVSEGDSMLITSSNNVPVLSELRAGSISLIDAITGAGDDSGSNTFTRNSTYQIPCTSKDIVDVPTVYTFVNGSSQFEDFKEGLLEDSNENAVFIIPLTSASKNGYDNASYFFQFMVPNNNTNPRNYYMYYVPLCSNRSGSTTSDSRTGGHGLVTSEPYDNIEKSERNDNNLIANTPVTYIFKMPELSVYEIAVTGTQNKNDIALRVEVLKGTSKLAKVQAPGIVYKNVNVWAGTKKIKAALIRFRVENSWLESNSLAEGDIKMVKWDGSRWTQIETAEKTKDGTYTYYEAKTDAFYVFAIIGSKGSVIVPVKGTVTSTPAPSKKVQQQWDKFQCHSKSEHRYLDIVQGRH